MLELLWFLFPPLNIGLTNLLLYVFATIGLTSLIIESEILESFREFCKKHLPKKAFGAFQCFQCMGFWTGALCGLIFVSFNLFIIIACGWAGSFLSPFLEKLTNYFDALAFLAVIQKDDNE